MNIITAFAVSFMAFFAILNSLGNMPVFISLTTADDPKVSRSIAKEALFISTISVVLFALVGKYIFYFFGIDLSALRIIGEIVIAIIGYDMLKGKSSSLQHNVDPKNPQIDEQMSVAITPLAMPVLTGPGTIATSMNLADNHNPIIVIIPFAILAFLTYFLFVYGELIIKKLGQNLLTVITRLMGLILAVIGTDMVIAGLKAVFTILK